VERPLLVVKCGRTFPALVAARGDYDAWFSRALSSALAVREAHEGASLPDPSEVAGAVITGSPHSVTEPAPWMERAADWVRRADAAGTPVLGVCFGHQLVAWAYGATVRVAAQWEVGTREVEVTEAGRADPLLAGLPARFFAATSHRDEVVCDGAPAVRVLARNACGVQAIAVGDRVRGVQFHPEAGEPEVRGLIQGRIDRLREAGADRGAALAAIRPSPGAARVLRNFEQRFVGR
jgi:GMP synthase (glutamine-hydrolysing)